jgi:anti-anti-sigma regulatory factor
MTFKIERLAGGETAIVLRVCGQMQIECVNTLKELIEAENAKIALDLSEITLADSDAATFLAVCEIKGLELRNCPAFLRGWVAKEQARMGGHK